jgi:hypothetical protein
MFLGYDTNQPRELCSPFWAGADLANPSPTASHDYPRFLFRALGLARFPRARVVFSSFVRRTASASLARDWGRHLQEPQQERIAALFVVASLVTYTWKDSMTWASELEKHPEHLQAIGMISVENGNLEIALPI